MLRISWRNFSLELHWRRPEPASPQPARRIGFIWDGADQEAGTADARQPSTLTNEKPKSAR